MSTVARVAKNTGYLYAKMGVTMFISLYTTRLILNSLGASDFGIFNIVGGAIAMLGFLNAAMAGSTQRFLSYSEGEGDKEKQKKIFNLSILLHAGIAILVGCLMLIAGYFFFNGILNIPVDRVSAAKIVYGSLVVSTIFTVINVPYDALLNAHENMRYYALVGIFESLLKLGVAFIVIYTLHDKLIVYGILMAIIPFISLSIMRYYCHRHYEECILNPKRYFDKTLMREMTGFAGWNFMQTASAMISNYGLGIIVNMFFGTILNAAQGIANQISGQLMSINSVLMKAIHPVITKTEGGGDRIRSIKIAEITCKVAFFAIAVLALPAMITMSEILQIWLKDVPQYTAFFASCLLFVSMMEQSVTGLYSLINASGKIKRISIAKSCFKFFFLPLVFLFFKHGMSPVGAYCWLVIIQGVINGLFVTTFFANRELHYSIGRYIKNIFFPICFICLVTLTFGILFYHLIGQTLLGIGSIWVLCPILTSILSFYIFLNGEERSLAKSLVSSGLKRLKSCRG